MSHTPQDDRHKEDRQRGSYLPEPLRTHERLETGSSRLLVVDDKAENRQLLWAILSPQGYEVIEACDGLEALAVLRSTPIDLVLLDVMMPRMDGIDTCRAIRRELGLVTLPVIFVTALSDKLSRLRGQSVGGDEFLSKPIDETELLVRVRNLLRVKAYHDLRERHHEQLASELEVLREQLLRVERLATLGTLAGGVGHELNNILTVYLGTLHFVRERATANLPPREKDIDQLLRVADHIATHARHLLTLARPGPDYAERVDLREIVRATSSMLWVSGRTHRVLIEIAEPEAAVWVTVNRTRIEQVLVNLIGNAADAVTEAGDREGCIVVRVEPNADGTRVRCTVEDNGCGIPPERLNDVFEAYYTTKPPESGTGLGLPVVKRIVNEFQGTVTVESELGVGTTFAFDLPIAP